MNDEEDEDDEDESSVDSGADMDLVHSLDDDTEYVMPESVTSSVCGYVESDDGIDEIISNLYFSHCFIFVSKGYVEVAEPQPLVDIPLRRSTLNVPRIVIGDEL